MRLALQAPQEYDGLEIAGDELTMEQLQEQFKDVKHRGAPMSFGFLGWALAKGVKEMREMIRFFNEVRACGVRAVQMLTSSLHRLATPPTSRRCARRTRSSRRGSSGSSRSTRRSTRPRRTLRWPSCRPQPIYTSAHASWMRTSSNEMTSTLRDLVLAEGCEG